MFRIFGLIFLTVFSIKLCCQSCTRVHYLVDTKLVWGKYNGEAILTIDEFNNSTFKYIFDNPGVRLKKTGESTGELLIQDTDGSVILTNRSQKKVEMKHEITGPGAGYIIHDTLKVIEWQIFPKETKQIMDMAVQKATCKFGGRTYDAWFAPGIAISNGPYKFHGLPGLLMEIKSRDAKVHMMCKQIEYVECQKIKLPDSLKNQLPYPYVSVSEFLEEKKIFYQNLAIKANGVEGVEIFEPDVDFHFEKNFPR